MTLQDPPATIESMPRDEATEIRLNAALQEFHFSGNFFRKVVGGGVLEQRSASLELGEEYFLVTQRHLQHPSPNSLEIIQERSDRSWIVYRLRLRDELRTRDNDIAELHLYLDREVVPPRPRADVLWPPPSRFDPDGGRVYPTSTSQIIVRSSSGLPKCESIVGDMGVSGVGEGLYSIDFGAQTGDAVVWPPAGGFPQRLRFHNSELIEPEGVRLSSGDELIELHTWQADHSFHSFERAEILVPSERLWRRIRLNRLPLRPIPNGNVHSIDGLVLDLDAGAFGSINSGPIANETKPETPWYSPFERLIVGIAGPTASKRLASVRTKRQLVRWATDNRAQPLLPLLLCALSVEVNRGIS